MDLATAGRAYASVNQVRSWAALFVKTRGMYVWTDEPVFKEFMTGMKALLRNRTTYREAITWDMLARLIQWMVLAGYGWDYIVPLCYAYCWAIRGGELLVLPDLPCVADLGPTLHLSVPAFKQWKQATSCIIPKKTVPGTLYKIISHPWPRDILRVVPRRKLNTAIQQGATVLGWKGWFTLHSVKHGRCVDYRARYGMSDSDIASAVRLRSKATVKLYAHHPQVAPVLGSNPADLTLPL
jgi:hypothetical protein